MKNLIRPLVMVLVASCAAVAATPESLLSTLDAALAKAGGRSKVGSSVEFTDAYARIEMIRAVYAGRLYLDPMLVEPVLRQRERSDEEPWNAALTPREREVMQMLCAGQRVSDIAVTLGLSIKTVSTHKVRLMEKLDITNNADLVKLGMRKGLS